MDSLQSILYVLSHVDEKYKELPSVLPHNIFITHYTEYCHCKDKILIYHESKRISVAKLSIFGQPCNSYFVFKIDVVVFIFWWTSFWRTWDHYTPELGDMCIIQFSYWNIDISKNCVFIEIYMLPISKYPASFLVETYDKHCFWCCFSNKTPSNFAFSAILNICSSSLHSNPWSLVWSGLTLRKSWN